MLEKTRIKKDTRFGGSSIQSHSWSGVVAQALTDDAIDRSVLDIELIEVILSSDR